jgi:hypothetical protein
MYIEPGPLGLKADHGATEIDVPPRSSQVRTEPTKDVPPCIGPSVPHFGREDRITKLYLKLTKPERFAKDSREDITRRSLPRYHAPYRLNNSWQK